MNSTHDFSYAKRPLRLTLLSLFSVAMLAAGMAASIPEADARGPGGGGAARAGGGGGGAARAGGGGGHKAQSSISAANHAGRPNAGNHGNAGNRPGNNADRPNRPGNNANRPGNNSNGGNYGNGNNNYSGNKINTGNVNIGNDVNIDIDGGYGHGGGYYRHPIATGVAIGAVAATTAAVLGSSYYALPPSGCSNIVRNGIPYYYCGSVYYQQSWSGNDVVYVVVNP